MTTESLRGNNRPAWMERPTAWGNTLKGSVLSLVIVLVTFPFLVLVSTSLAPQKEITQNGGFVIFPRNPTLDAYRELLSGGIITRAVLISVGVTLIGTMLSLTVTVLAAYGLSRRGSFGHRPLLLMFLFTFVLPPGFLPTYLVVRQLHLLENWAALVLPVAINVFNLVVLRGFFAGIPAELLDAARIDGAGEWRILGTIVLPVSKAVMAVVGLFYAVGYWNAWFSTLLYLNDAHDWPLQYVLRTYVLQGSPIDSGAGSEALPPQQATQMAVVVLALIPIVCVYPFLQRHFTKGVLVGAIKG
jgi:putative aldouronate transport system permease protein